MGKRILELFKGTGSIGKPFHENGWEVVSVDILEKFQPTICCNVMDLEYRQWSPGHFDVVWASPPCTHYSRARTRAKTPRDLEGSDAIVMRVREIIEYLKPTLHFMENPATGLLRLRPCMLDMPTPLFVDYCMYGLPYRKRTAIWTNAKTLELSLCNKACGHYENGKHTHSAQRGNFKLEDLYRIPDKLCEAFFEACERECRVDMFENWPETGNHLQFDVIMNEPEFFCD